MTRLAPFSVLALLVLSLSWFSQVSADEPPIVGTGHGTVVGTIAIPMDRAALLQRYSHILYAKSDVALVAIDPVTARVLWRVPHHIGQFVHLADEFVLVQDRNGLVRRLDPSTGRTQWTLALGATAGDGGSIEISGVVYIWARTDPADQQTAGLYAVDVRTGTVRWRAWSMGGIVNLQGSGNRLILAEQTQLRVLDVVSGRTLWSRDLASPNQPGQLVVDGDTVYFTDRINPPDEIAIHAFALDTGRVRWSHTVRDCTFGTVERRGASAVVGCQTQHEIAFDDRLDVYMEDTYVSFDVESGREQWRVAPAQGSLPSTNPRVSAGGTTPTYGLAHHIFTAVDLDTGAVLCRYALRDDAFVLSWGVIDTVLYLSYSVPTGDDRTQTRVLAVEPASGQIEWQLDLDDEWFVLDGMASARKGRLYGFGPTHALALDEGTGTILWSLTLPPVSDESHTQQQFARIEPGSPSYILTTDGTLYAITETAE